jgi:ATPase subunit of ABC transporter with duplicated ATPase domains
VRGLSMASVVVARGVSFEFSNGRELFKNLSFAFDAKLAALVGPNGIGKTVLAKLLIGEIQPTSGFIRRDSSVVLFPQHEVPQRITVDEYLTGDYQWSMLGERLLQNIERQRSCTMLSGGEWMRVRLARALRDDFLILDEPTNNLDREGRDAVHQFLHSRTGGALLISHDRECLQLCEEVYELSNRGLAKFGHGWSAYVAAKASERERVAAALDIAKRERGAALAARAEQRARQQKRNHRGARAAARGGTPKILLGARKRRAQATSGRLDASTLEQAEAAIRDAHAALSEMKVEAVMYADVIGREMPAQKLVAEARGFNIRFQDWIYAEDLEFTWRGNVRVALQGANGSGKSTLLNALLGSEFDTRGQLRRGAVAAMYLDQRCRSLDDSESVFDNVRAVSSGTDSEIRNGLARFLFNGSTVFQKAGNLSGGERLRAALAQGLLSTRQPEVLLLDEPTNNLDLANLEFLERVVSEFRGALVIVSHDENFLENCGVTQELIVRAWSG